MNDNNIKSGSDIVVEVIVEVGMGIMNEPIISVQIVDIAKPLLSSICNEILSASAENTLNKENDRTTCARKNIIFLALIMTSICALVMHIFCGKFRERWLNERNCC